MKNEQGSVLLPSKGDNNLDDLRICPVCRARFIEGKRSTCGDPECESELAHASHENAAYDEADDR